MFSIDKKTSKTLVALFFIISGATGLIYQITWFKYLSIYLGNTTYAQMTVLGTFLGGLAIGNYYYGKKSDLLKNNLLTYGLLELSIGFYCLVYPTVSAFLGDKFISIFSELNMSSENIFFIVGRFLFSSFLLFIPTFAMGGTFPVLSKFFIRGINNVRRDLAILYFLNSLGAVWGIIFAGFYLIKIIGMDNTMYLAAMLNLIVGILSIIISKMKMIETSEELIIEEEKNDEIVLSKKTILAVVITAGLSGFSALLYEIVWVRLLVNFFGSSTYAFSVMLLAFISGITLGSLIISQEIFKKFNRIKLLIYLQAGIGISTMITLSLYERVPYYLWKISSLLNKTPQTFDLFLFSEFLICFSLLVIPTILMGMSLPHIVNIVSNNNKKIGFSVGKIFSINTLGTVLGVLITSLIFIPLTGIKGAFEIGIGINIITAFMLIYLYDGITNELKITLTVTFAGIFVLFIILFPDWNKKVLLSGVFRKLDFNAPASYSEFEAETMQDTILYYKEGITSNVAVLGSKNNVERRLIINGKPDASTGLDVLTQTLLGQIPTMLHTNTKDVFVVGFGSGSTIGSVLTHPVETVTCAEINKEVIEAADFFSSINYDCLKDSRLNVVVEDALTYLKVSNKKYDVIISEPSNPWIAGIGNLFSVEYFDLCKNKLNDNGIMAQWFHSYELNDEILKLVLSSFKYVFPYAQVWGTVKNDLLIIGSKNKINIDFNLLEEKFNIPSVNNDFRKIGIDNLFTLLSLQQLSSYGVYKLTNYNRLNRELHPLLEFLAPISFFVGKTTNLIHQYDEKLETIDNELLVNKYFNEKGLNEKDAVNAAKYHFSQIYNNKFVSALTRNLIENGNNNYEVKLLNYQSQQKLTTKILSMDLNELYNEYSDSTFINEEYFNSQIRKNLNSTSFIKRYPIEEYIEEIVSLDEKSSLLKKVNTFIDASKVLYDNGEIDAADKYRSLANDIILGNPNLVPDQYFEKFLFINSKINLYYNRETEFFADMRTLLDYFPMNRDIEILGRMWRIKKEKEALLLK